MTICILLSNKYLIGVTELVIVALERRCVRGDTAEIVWVGHACPTLMGLILGLDLGSLVVGGLICAGEGQQSKSQRLGPNSKRKIEVKVKDKIRVQRHNSTSRASDKSVRPTQGL
jgi:hypothetical protein